MTGLLVLGLGGCNRGGAENKEAVRQAVIDYLSKRAGINVSSMQVDIVSVAFRENEADVTCSFRPKGADASAPGMNMSYTLTRQGNAWVVKGRSDSGAGSHGAGGEMPGGMPSGHPQIPTPQGESKSAAPPAESKK